MGKKLTVYMIDGTECGPRIAEIGNWVGISVFKSISYASLVQIMA